MRKPDFLVIGAMKCATSTVCAYLEDHPDVFMVAGCEPNYFSHDDVHARGPDAYAAHFAGRRGERICGEGSNDYAAGALYPRTVERLAAFLPDVKLIYMVRHPVDRILSAWVQNRTDSGDDVPPSPDEAVRAMPKRFVDQSLYWRNLSRYRAAFPDERIFVGFMEDMAADRAAFFARLAEFLGVPRFDGATRPHVNPMAGKRMPSRAYSLANRLPFADAAKRVAPEGLKRFVKARLLSRTVERPPALSGPVAMELAATLRDDAAALLDHCGKPADFWRI